MSGRPTVVIVSTYPPEHCGVGRDAFQVVQPLRELRPVRVVANLADGTSLPDPSVEMVWRKNDPFYPWRIVNAVRRAAPDRRSIVHVFHHFFLYGGPLTVPLFPAAVLLLRLQGYRIVVQFQSVIDLDGMEWNGRAPSGLVRLVLIFLLRRFYRGVAGFSDAIVICTPSMRDLLIKAYHIAGRKLWLVPVGWQLSTTALSRDEAKRGLGLKGHRVILFHGFLDPTKGLDHLLEAFAELVLRFPDLMLVLAGETSPTAGMAGVTFVDHLRLRCRDMNLETRVRFTGYLDNTDLDRALAASDVIVLPYTMRFSHGGSASLSRIAGVGRPLVVSRISRFIDELVDEESALFVTPGDTRELSVAISRILEDPAFAESLGSNLASLARRRTWGTSARLLDQQVYPTSPSSSSTSTSGRGPRATTNLYAGEAEDSGEGRA